MALYFLPNGLGESLGDPLAVTEPLYIAGADAGVKYVSSVIGDDANDGDREAPYEKLATAVGAVGAGDIIVLMDGHTETMTTPITVSVDCSIIGAGSSGGYPTVKLTNNAANTNLLIITAKNTQIRNIWFNTNAQSCSVPLITLNSGIRQFRMHGCYFECTSLDAAGTIKLNVGDNAASVTLKNNTFVSTQADPGAGAARTARPPYGIFLGADLGLLTMDGDVFDGGVVGWDDGTAVKLITEAALDYFWAENVSFLRGSDCEVDEPNTKFYINAQTSTGSVVRF